MSEQGPVDEGGDEEVDGGAAEDFSVPMWVWTVLAFVLLMAVVIVVIIRGGAKRDVPAEPGGAGAGAAVTQPVEEPVTQPATQPG